MDISSVVLPVLILGVFLYGLIKKVNLLEAFTDGASEGLKTAVSILPTLIFLMLGVNMLRASGALGALTDICSGIMNKLGFPAECLPLALLRPVSGSGALAIFSISADRTAFRGAWRAFLWARPKQPFTPWRSTLALQK